MGRVKYFLERALMGSAATKRSSQHQLCAKVCLECESACQLLIPHCLELGGRHAGPAHIGVLIDCAGVCMLAHQFLSRESAFSAAVCGACETICRACAADCESFVDEDPHMMACADACKRCAAWCHSMNDGLAWSATEGDGSAEREPT